jgi:hypothetical protein
MSGRFSPNKKGNEMKKLETIWDFNPTKEELQSLLIADIYENKEEYLKETSEEQINLDLYRLFDYRDDDKRDDYFTLLSKEIQKDIEWDRDHPSMVKTEDGEVILISQPPRPKNN